MKKGLISALLFLILTACTPLEDQIQAAIKKTQTAQPSITPSPEATPTYSYSFLLGLTHDNLIDLLEGSAMQCEDPTIESDGSYTQGCHGVITNGMSDAEIQGNSESTVDNFMITFTPFSGEDLTNVISGVFQNAVDFGDYSENMKEWINQNINIILDSSEGVSLTEELPGIYIMLSGINGSAMIGVLATN